MSSKIKAMSTEEKRQEIEDAIRTLQRAETIRSNTKLMSDVKSSLSTLQKVVGGRTSTSSKKK